MGRIFPIPRLSSVNNTIKASNDYIKRIGGAEQIPPVKIPQIDFSKDVIVVWVPGTNDRNIPKVFLREINTAFKNSTVVLSDYVATWNFSVSIPHGVFTLAAILNHIKKNKKKNAKVFLAGQSQGALVVGEAMAKKEYFSLVNRAVLFSHPGVSKHHYEGASKVVEFNNQYDVTTFEWGQSDEDKEKIIRAVDEFMTGDLTKALYLLKVGFKNPLDAAWLGISSLRLLPVPIFKGIPAFHDVSDEDYRRAINYLRDGFNE